MAALCCLPIAGQAGPMENKAMQKLDPEERAHQACSIKGVETLRRDKRLPGADRIKTRVTGAAALDGSVVTGKGGAVRAKGRWYALKFTCTVTADRMKAVRSPTSSVRKFPKQSGTTTACGARPETCATLHRTSLARPALQYALRMRSSVPGRQRAVRFEVGFQSGHLGGPAPGSAASLSTVNPSPPSARKALTVTRYWPQDRSGVRERDALGGHEVAAGPAVVPGVGKALRHLQQARLGLVEPLLLEQRLDLRSGQRQRDERSCRRAGQRRCRRR